MPDRYMTADDIAEEFGLNSTEGLPVSGCRRVDGESILLYRESDVIRPEDRE